MVASRALAVLRFPNGAQIFFNDVAAIQAVIPSLMARGDEKTQTCDSSIPSLCGSGASVPHNLPTDHGEPPRCFSGSDTASQTFADVSSSSGPLCPSTTKVFNMAKFDSDTDDAPLTQMPSPTTPIKQVPDQKQRASRSNKPSRRDLVVVPLVDGHGSFTFFDVTGRASVACLKRIISRKFGLRDVNLGGHSVVDGKHVLVTPFEDDMPVKQAVQAYGQLMFSDASHGKDGGDQR